MLFRADGGMAKYISGVILYDETIRQNAKDGTPLVKLIEQARRRFPASRSTRARKPLPICPGEAHHRRPRQARRAPAGILRAAARASPNGAR